MKKKIRHKKEIEDTVEKKNMIEDTMIEASRGLLVEQRTVEYIKMNEEDLPAEIDQAVLGDMGDTMMIEKMVEEDQQKLVNIQTEDMMKKTEEQMMRRKEQEAPQGEDIEKTVLTMNMVLKEK